jgi:hypothetical protein
MLPCFATAPITRHREAIRAKWHMIGPLTPHGQKGAISVASYAVQLRG